MSCAHRWQEQAVVTPTTSRVACSVCGVTGYAKARQAEHGNAYTVATERVCAWLMVLLAQRGIKVNAPLAELSRPLEHEWRHGATAVLAQGPWYCWASVTPDLGAVVPVAYDQDPAGASWPAWLYHFDRWICRLDGWGGNNFVARANGEVVPLDFGCAFGWALGVPFARTVHDLTVPAHPGVSRAADPAVRDAIKTITNDDIRNATVHGGIPAELCPTALLVAWWSGLCYRRDAL